MWRGRTLNGRVQDQVGVDPHLNGYAAFVKSLGIGVNFVYYWAEYCGSCHNFSYSALENLFSK